jgi:hypothetical protein
MKGRTVPERSPVRLALISAGSLCGAALAAASIVVLHGPAMLLVAVAATVAAGAAALTTEEGRPAAAALAWKAAAITVAAIVLVSGLAVVAGGAVAAIGGLGSAVVAAGALLLRARSRSAARTERRRSGPPRWDRPAAQVGQLPTSALASEWRRTTGELAGCLDPRTRQAVVRRRQETLDELERRDPIGFARWIAVGAPADIDPAEFVQNPREPGTDAFGGQP